MELNLVYGNVIIIMDPEHDIGKMVRYGKRGIISLVKKMVCGNIIDLVD